MIQNLVDFPPLSFVNNERGATMVEYAVMLVSIAAICTALVGQIGVSVSDLFRLVSW